MTNESFVPVSSVAAEVAEDHNNPAMEGWLRLYLDAVERSGFRIVRADNGRRVYRCSVCARPDDDHRFAACDGGEWEPDDCSPEVPDGQGQ